MPGGLHGWAVCRALGCNHTAVGPSSDLPLSRSSHCRHRSSFSPCPSFPLKIFWWASFCQMTTQEAGGSKTWLLVSEIKVILLCVAAKVFLLVAWILLKGKAFKGREAGKELGSLVFYLQRETEAQKREVLTARWLPKRQVTEPPRWWGPYKRSPRCLCP